MRVVRAVLAVAIVLSFFPSFAAAPENPRVSIVREGDRFLVRADSMTRDGATHGAILRETADEPTRVTGGRGPEGRAAFVTWSEAGRRWSSYSRDGGQSWSEARPLRTELRLRGVAVDPGQAMPAVAEGFLSPPDSRIFVVQLGTPSLPEWRTAIARRGAEIVATLPHNAHVVRVSPARVDELGGLEFVERVEPMHPGYRLEPELQSWVGGASDTRESSEGELRIRVMTFEWGPSGKHRVAAAAEALGARVADQPASGHVVELWVRREHVASIAAHDDVMWVERWTERETDMNLVREDAGTDWLEANFSYCGQGVRGEVLDAGIQADHPDFAGLLAHGLLGVHSHGTSTYGIVFGNGSGSADATGHMPCPEVQGIAADFNNMGDRFAHTQELKAAPYFASFQSNSWGDSRTTSYNSVSAEMDDIIFRLDIAVTQSQSNAGNQQSRPQAWAKNIISVGGIRHQNTLTTADDSWGLGASIGPASDGRIKPDLNYWYDSIRTTTTGSGYTSSFGGTSAATPEVAGVLGLIVQMWSENVWNTNPIGSTVFERQPHFSTIKALLINNAQQYVFSGASHDLTRTHQGWGRPSARIAKERASTSFVVDEDDVLTVGQTQAYGAVVAPGESELKITMVYPDPMGAPFSSVHRVNDVDLRVISPSSVVYHGNVGLNVGNYSTPGGAPNTIDTVENVFVQNPESGTWTVEVTASEINEDGHLATTEDDVAYALVVTGGAFGSGECGNGIREPGEQCDGDDVGGVTCGDLGCSGGALTCTGSCLYDLSSCTGCPTCDDDGVCEPLENCFVCPGDCRSGSGAECGNGVCETADGENCSNCAADCNGRLGGKPSTRYCCSDGTGVANAVTCADSRCGNECLSTPAVESCCGDGVCTGDESSVNCDVDCLPGCADAETAGSTCTDGVDNDCDGPVDCDDPDCSLDATCCTLAPLGDPCDTDAECCSSKCKGPSGRKTCK